MLVIINAPIIPSVIVKIQKIKSEKVKFLQ
jgi:hypothetical protein